MPAGDTQLTLTDFLLQRIAEDADAAERCRQEGPWRYDPAQRTLFSCDGWDIATLTNYHDNSPDYYSKFREPGMPNPQYLHPDATGAHVARHDPVRVLAECKAKRRIVKAFRKAGSDDALAVAVKHLAVVWADHEDYQDAWKP